MTTFVYDIASNLLSMTDDTWDAVDAAFRVGNRGLPGGSSRARLLAEHLDVPKTSCRMAL